MPTLLLRQEDFRAWVPADQSLQWGPVVIASALSAQASYIRAAVCPDLYDELVAQVETDTLTIDNMTLLYDYIAPCLAWYAFADALPYLQQRVGEAGPSNLTGQNTTPAPQAELSLPHRRALDKAKVFQGMLVEYLVKNRDTYPLYNCCGDDAAYSGSRFFFV